jgi:predicted nuclease of predicted toxin-antitoxin system
MPIDILSSRLELVMPVTLDDLLSEAQIKDLHLRFCRANDRRDEELMRSCFHADAIIDLHESLNVEAFIALGREVLGRFTVTWHNTGNQLVEVKGDSAWAEHYTISSHRIAADAEGPERDFIAYGRYIDRVERRQGEWRFARRTMLLDFTRTDPVGMSASGFGTQGGARDRTDKSYLLRLTT